MNSHLQDIIEENFNNKDTLSPKTASSPLCDALEAILEGLDLGQLRVAEFVQGKWIVHEWLKKSILLMFKVFENKLIDAKFCQFYDKLPLKFNQFSLEQFQAQQVRVVPHAIVRRGAFVGKNSILMPSYVNIGAYIDEGAMIDTWATVGSCAQIGKGVHLSGGAGIGGVLEPLQATQLLLRIIVLLALVLRLLKASS